MQRAKRELVSVLLFQKKYDEALSLAKENYEQDSDNTYHIHAYFRCLVKKHKMQRADIKKIESLMDAVQKSYSAKKEELYAAMNIEYCAYVKRDNVQKVLSMIREYEREFPGSMDVKRSANDYKQKQHIPSDEDCL